MEESSNVSKQILMIFLQTFTLVKFCHRSNNLRKTIYFCWSDQNGYVDMVHKSCTGKWKNNFILYEKQNSSNAIEILNYNYSGVTSKLSLKKIKINSSFTLPDSTDWVRSFYIPGKICFCTPSTLYFGRKNICPS